jgi:hypothetical protein
MGDGSRHTDLHEGVPQLMLVVIKGLEELGTASVALPASKQAVTAPLLDGGVAELRNLLVRRDPVVVSGAEDCTELVNTGNQMTSEEWPHRCI